MGASYLIAAALEAAGFTASGHSRRAPVKARAKSARPRAPGAGRKRARP
jgi:hypothetical protein